jgi:SAM-dependent methyltransferase
MGEICPLFAGDPVALARPILEVGCGKGEFGSLALDGTIDVGLDRSQPALTVARTRGNYLACVCGDVGQLPFATGSYASVVAISVLEHVSRPGRALGEICRVLRAGGVFLGTVVLADLYQHLFYPDLLGHCGLELFARSYVRCHQRYFRHQSLYSREKWEELLRETGLEIVRTESVVGHRLTRWWDFLLPLALPYWLAGRWGRAVIWHPRWFRDVARRFINGILEGRREAGNVLLFLARKPAGSTEPGVQHGEQEKVEMVVP